MLKSISIVIPTSFHSDGLSLFIQLRRESGPLDGMWEFPGGKIDQGEAPIDAAAREFEEEVGVSVDQQDLKAFSIYPFEYDDRSLLFYIYYIDASLLSGKKHELTEQKISWETAKNDVKSANIPEANKNFLMQFIEFKKTQLGIL